MIKPRARQTGFTIVELLIVIVVIGILAAITIVAYNGIQQRARNNQTLVAVESWVKGLQLYKVDKGRWPNYYTCLGDNYLYDSSGTASSGIGQCRQDDAGSGAVVSTAFNNEMQAYISNRPTPAMVTAASTATVWRRGLNYYFGGGAGTDVYILAVLDGSLGSCPSAAGVTGAVSVIYGGNTVCYYLIGKTTDT